MCCKSRGWHHWQSSFVILFMNWTNKTFEAARNSPWQWNKLRARSMTRKPKQVENFPDLFSPPARAARVRPFRVFLPSLSWSQNIDPTELTWKSEMQAAFALSLHHTRGDVAAVSLRSSVCTPHMTHFFGDFCVDSFSSCILIPSLQLA